MAEIRVKVIPSGGEVSSVWNTRIEVPDNYRFVNGATLSQSQFNELQGMPVADRGLAIVGGAVTRQSGTAQGPKSALNDYRILMRRDGVSANMQSQQAASDWHRSNQSGATGTPFQRTDVHGADAEASQMYTSGMIGIAGGGMSLVGFGVAGLAIRGLATGVGALVGRMGASAAASAATKKGVEYGAGLIFGGMYIGEAIKTGGANVTDPYKGKASDQAGALSTLTGGLWGLTGLPDIPLPAALAKGANTASGILAPALFLGLLPWGRLGKGGKEGKQEGDFSGSPPFGKDGKEGKQEGGFPLTWPRDKKRGGFFVMPEAFVDNFQKSVEAMRKGMGAFELKDGKWQLKDPEKRRLFLLPGQKPEQDSDTDTGSESGPVIDYAPDPEVIPDPIWNPDPAIDFVPEPDALNPLPLPGLLPIPAPEQGPAPWPVDPAPGNWNPGPNIDPVPDAPAPRPAEGGEARERWDRNERLRHAQELEQEREDKQWEKDQLAQWQLKEDWNRRNRHWRAPEPNPRPIFPERPKPVPPRPYPGEKPGTPAPDPKPKPPPKEIPKPLPPTVVPPLPEWKPRIPLPPLLPGQVPNPALQPKPVPNPALPIPDVKPDIAAAILAAVILGAAKLGAALPEVGAKPEVKPEPKPELEPAKPKVGRRVGVGVRKGHGDFDDDEESFPGISMRYGNWLPAAPSFHTGQYPIPPYIIKSGRIVYNVD